MEGRPFRRRIYEARCATGSQSTGGGLRRSLRRAMVGVGSLAIIVALVGCHRNAFRRDIVRADGATDPERAQHWHEKGVALVRRGDATGAEAAFENAVLADPSFGPAHNNLGLLQYQRHDLYSAAWSFERAMQLMPERPEPTNNLAMVYEAAGRLGEAVDLYQTAVDQAPADAVYLGNLLRVRIRRGDRDPAIRDQLKTLLFLDDRPEWVEWAEDQLALFQKAPPATAEEESQPEVIPAPAPASANISDGVAPRAVGGAALEEITIPDPLLPLNEPARLPALP